MKKNLLMGLIAITTMAFGQTTKTIPSLSAPGATFSSLYDSGTLQGTLTSVGINATLSAQTGTTWADDLSIVATPTGTLTTGTPLLQIGGASDFGADEYDTWTNGGSSTIGTVVNDTYTLTTPINMTANPLYSMWIGNGYSNSAGTNTGTWTNITVTLTGVSVSSLGTKDITAKSDLDIKVYPNPVIDVVNLKSNDSKITLVSVIDMSGKAIKTVMSSEKTNEIAVNVSELNAGSYLLIIHTDKNKFSKKIIKK